MSGHDGGLPEPPEDLCCPISSELMRDPVITVAGNTYERCMIEQWFARGKTTDPMTNEKVGTMLIPNNQVKKMTAEWLGGLSAEHRKAYDARLDARQDEKIRAKWVTEMVGKMQGSSGEDGDAGAAAGTAGAEGGGVVAAAANAAAAGECARVVLLLQARSGKQGKRTQRQIPPHTHTHHHHAPPRAARPHSETHH